MDNKISAKNLLNFLSERLTLEPTNEGVISNEDGISASFNMFYKVEPRDILDFIVQELDSEKNEEYKFKIKGKDLVNLINRNIN